MTFNNNYETYRGLLKQHLVRGEAMIPFVALVRVVGLMNADLPSTLET